MIKIEAYRRIFFTSAEVLAKTDKATRRVLSRFGALVRSSARRSIRKRKKKISRPGEPPSSHAPHLLRNFILFGYDSVKNSVVIGPAEISGTLYEDTPQVIEYGGTRQVLRVIAGQGRLVTARYAPRPAMRLALNRERPKLQGLWKNAIR